MLPKVIALACLTVFAGVGAALAQADDLPAELPAADYQGQSYVDSTGCIFVKAGYGGNASWVPRVGQDRKPVCGQTPTNAVAKVTQPIAPPTHKARAKKRAARVAAPVAPVMIGCPISAPVARRYATTDGGSVVVCTATNGSLTGARSPIYPASSGVGAALSKTRFPGVAIPLPDAAVAAASNEALPQDAVAKPRPALVSVTAGGAYYVQVGAFAQPSNADGASARLATLGLPVSKGNFTKQGRSLQVIYAGPFASGADAKAALAAAQSNGFSDAYIR